MKTIALMLAAGFALYSAASAAPAASPVSHGIAVLLPGTGSVVKGTVHFKKEPSGVRVTGAFTGLPAGAHGFHIHEFGDCSAPDFTSAGDHFNPSGNPHGAPTDPRRHEGDMGNINATADGKGTIDYVDKHLRFDGAPSILGRGVIVHEKADDFKTQPTGDAGGRIACGVIGSAKNQ